MLTEENELLPRPPLLTARTIRRLGLLVAALTLTLAFSGLVAAQFHADRRNDRRGTEQQAERAGHATTL